MQLVGEVCPRCADIYLGEREDEEEDAVHEDHPVKGDEQTPVTIQSMYGARTKTPMVIVQIEDRKALMWSTSDARKIAHMLLEAAETAEQDGFIVEHFMEEFELSEEQAALMLRAFRDHRERWRTSYTLE
jgi:hypothetical protein